MTLHTVFLMLLLLMVRCQGLNCIVNRSSSQQQPDREGILRLLLVVLCTCEWLNRRRSLIVSHSYDQFHREGLVY